MGGGGRMRADGLVERSYRRSCRMGGSLTGYLAAGFRELLAVEHGLRGKLPAAQLPPACACARATSAGLRVGASGSRPASWICSAGRLPSPGFSAARQAAHAAARDHSSFPVRPAAGELAVARVRIRERVGLVHQFYEAVRRGLRGAGKGECRISPVIVLYSRSARRRSNAG